jgi:hypothetical protein
MTLHDHLVRAFLIRRTDDSSARSLHRQTTLLRSRPAGPGSSRNQPISSLVSTATGEKVGARRIGKNVKPCAYRRELDVQVSIL